MFLQFVQILVGLLQLAREPFDFVAQIPKVLSQSIRYGVLKKEEIILQILIKKLKSKYKYITRYKAFIYVLQ